MFEIGRPLTETDRSYVFLGSPVEGGKPVAIKVLKERRAKDSRFMRHHHADMVECNLCGHGVASAKLSP